MTVDGRFGGFTAVGAPWVVIMTTHGATGTPVAVGLSGWRPSVFGDGVGSRYITMYMCVCVIIFANVFHVNLSNKRLLNLNLNLRTNFGEILSEVQTLWFKKMHLKISFAKGRPFCLGLNILKCYSGDNFWDRYMCPPSFASIDAALTSGRCLWIFYMSSW